MATVLYLYWEADEQPGGSMTMPLASAPDQTRLDVGLSPQQQADWHHLDEGSGFIPLSFFYALKDAESGRPFIEALPRFGLVPDPDNDLGLPIGFTAATLPTAPNNSLFAGVNCAACHSGQYNYRGAQLIIDGAPNLLDFENLLDGLVAAVTKTVESPAALLDMVHAISLWERRLSSQSQLLALHPDTQQLLGDIVRADDSHPLAAVKQGLQQGLHQAYHTTTAESAGQSHPLAATLDHPALVKHAANASMLQRLRDDIATINHDLAFIRSHAERLVTLSESFKGETVAGPGRADSFDAIWDLVIQKDAVIAMTAPVSIPQLFDYANFEWVHWDGNTTAVVERDYAQAIALGADFNPATGDSTVIPQAVITLEQTAHHLTAPRWPETILGTIDQTKAGRGADLFMSHCAECHSSETLTPIAEVGTDPNRALNFAKLQHDGKSYAELLAELGNTVVSVSLAKHNMDPADMAGIEHSDAPGWRITNAYHARTLVGIWASAPYLHNGSVPTLRDLLEPAASRPTQFLVGRELDPVKVGIDSARQPDSAWTFNIDEEGNSNQGHEYGIDLSNPDKEDLIEYLKTL
ncbi:MAG: hypothetical protein Tsb002_26980 [Wenzhouxiangellaceae bacterium]